jgi:hypothetical protein
MIDAALQHATSVAVGSDLYAVGSHCVVYELPHQSQFTNTTVQHRHTPHLVIFRCELVETFLNNVIPVEILDEHYNMKAECKNNRMNLSVVSMISLRSTVSLEDKNPLKRLAWRLVDKKSIIFCTARVPCMFNEMLTRS